MNCSRLPLTVLSVLLSGATVALGQDADTIVRRSVDRDWTDFGSQRNYIYTQRSEFRDIDKDGTLRRKRSETSEILILSGRRYERRVAHDDKPLAPSDERKEQEKMDREAAKRNRETPGERAKWEKQRAEDRAFIREVPEAFRFRLTGTDAISGQPAWVLEAEPRPSYKPVHSRADMFSKVRAKVWIEKATYHWVKVEAQVLGTLSFGFGLFRVAPGTTLSFEQTRINDEIWLPSSMQMRGDARLALIKKIRAEVDVRYRDYRKFQGESRVIETAPNAASQ